MPARVVVELAPTDDRLPVPPARSGPAVHAALLAALRHSGFTQRPESFHGVQGGDQVHPLRPDPFAVTPLLDEFDRPARADSRQVRFEVGILFDPIVAAVLGALSRTATVRVARCAYRIAALTVAAAAAYPDLLASARPNTVWNLRMLTPMASTPAAGGTEVNGPVPPDPQRVFGSLYALWHTFAGPSAPLPDALPVMIAGKLELVEFRPPAGEPAAPAAPSDSRAGRIVYRVISGSPAPDTVLAGLDALMTFASYAGIGEHSSLGMGQIRHIPAVFGDCPAVGNAGTAGDGSAVGTAGDGSADAGVGQVSVAGGTR